MERPASARGRPATCRPPSTADRGNVFRTQTEAGERRCSLASDFFICGASWITGGGVVGRFDAFDFPQDERGEMGLAFDGRVHAIGR